MFTGKFSSRLASPSSRVIVSVLLHCALLSLFLYKGRTYIAPMLLPGDARGTQLTLTYVPGRAPKASAKAFAETRLPPADLSQSSFAIPTAVPPLTSAQPPAALDAKQVPAPSPDKNDSPVSVNPDAASGADSLGTGNINIAYLDSFRSPRPDLSSLPRGVSGDVILDVTIDTAGKIIALKKLSGVGYGIDESVIATVQAWVFHPATRDGTPVVSEQELHFHYEHVRNG